MAVDFVGGLFIPSALIIFLLFCSGVQDVVASFSPAFSCQSIRWRIILLFALLSSVLAAFFLQGNFPSFRTWMQRLDIAGLPEGDDLRVICPSLVAASIASVLASLLNFPLPLSPLILLSQLASMLIVKGDAFPFKRMFRQLMLVYLGLPMFAGCVTWLVNRIFLQVFIFGEAESRFRRTLAWASIFYPVSLGVAAAAVLPRLLAIRFGSRLSGRATLYVLAGSVLIGVLSFFAFKIFFRAVVKRRAFLKYPQEFALYLDRADRPDRTDMEARGLGPSRMPQSLLSSQLPSSSPASAHQTPSLLHAKRSEELFRPLLLVLSVATSLSVSFTEAINLIAMLRHITARLPDAGQSVIMIGFSSLILGRLVFSKRVCRFAATGIISELTPSQAFAIQFGVLLTAVVAGWAQVSLISAPVFYWISALTAVGVSKTGSASPTKQPQAHDVPQPSNWSLLTTRTLSPALPSPLQEETFRKHVYGRLVLFWALMCLMSFAFGFLVF